MTPQIREMSVTERLRHIAKPVLNVIAGGLLAIGITPNAATIIGAIGNVSAAVLIATGFLTWGGLAALFWVLFDAVDGTMARISQRSSKTGAFLDSTLDRYVEFFLLTGLVWYFIAAQNPLGILLGMITFAGSVFVSYTRARAEGLGLECKVGILTRVERFMILIPALIFHLPILGLIIMAVLTHVTALQRMVYVIQQARNPQ